MNNNRLAYFESLTDQTLVGLLFENNSEAVDYLLFHRCNGMFAHVVHSVFSHTETIEDLITEFYLFISDNNWDKLRKFEFRSSLNTYLTVLAVRFFKKMKISQTKIVPVDPQLIVETQKNNPDDYDIEHEISRMEMYKAIDELSKPRERYALLSELNGMSAEEIAVDMGCTVSAVYNLTKKARLELKNKLKEGAL